MGRGGREDHTFRRGVCRSTTGDVMRRSETNTALRIDGLTGSICYSPGFRIPTVSHSEKSVVVSVLTETGITAVVKREPVSLHRHCIEGTVAWSCKQYAWSGLLVMQSLMHC